jgi:hypothetical protein
MAAPTINKAIGGVTPLGIITITPGTPIQVTSNLGISDTNFGKLMCRQIGLSLDSTPAGEIYVNYGNFAGKGKATAMIIQSGTVSTLPWGCEVEDGLLDATAWWLDGSAACVVAVYALDASS